MNAKMFVLRDELLCRSIQIGIITAPAAADEYFCAYLVVFFEDEGAFAQKAGLHGAH